MIGKLTGRVDTVGEDHVILDVGGVGYLVHGSSRLLAGLSAGESAALAIETYVREDMIRLYGFGSEAEREWFRLLQTVQGVGAKVALAILSVLDPSGLARAVAGGDRAAVSQAPGVGPKLAARIVAEMKDKAPVPAFAISSGPRAAGEPAEAPVASRDAVSALVNLGYDEARAGTAVAAALRSAREAASVQELLRAALRELARR